MPDTIKAIYVTRTVTRKGLVGRPGNMLLITDPRSPSTDHCLLHMGVGSVSPGPARLAADRTIEGIDLCLLCRLEAA